MSQSLRELVGIFLVDIEKLVSSLSDSGGNLDFLYYDLVLEDDPWWHRFELGDQVLQPLDVFDLLREIKLCILFFALVSNSLQERFGALC